MGMVDKFVNQIEHKIEDWLSGVVEGNFDKISSIMSNTFSETTGDDGLVKNYLTSHPANFTGSTSDTATTVWSTIETICNNVVVPIAGFILTIVVLNDLIQIVIRGNNFKDFDDTIFIKWIIKTVIGIILVSNTYYIASGLFSFGVYICAGALDKDTSGVDSLFGSGWDVSLSESLSGYSIGELLIMVILSFLILIAIFIIFAVIVVVLASRMIEIFMYLGASPIPMATLMNDEWGQIGKNWIKGILALSFQGFFIIIALAIFGTIFANVVTDIQDAADGIEMSMLLLAGYAAALIFTILRSGQISKSIFNAT